MIRQIVGRCHVADTYVEVLDYVVSRLRNGLATWREMPRADRHEVMRQIIHVHDENRNLYRAVMGGHL